MDEEGNGPGQFFGTNKNNESFMLALTRAEES
jgi:hypothetical protein